MRLLISCLLFPVMTHAHVIVLSHAPAQAREAEHIFKVMQERYKIPQDFIKVLSHPKPCEHTQTPVSWHLCFDETGTLRQVTVDRVFLRETLRALL